MKLCRLDGNDPRFDDALKARLTLDAQTQQSVRETVADIIADVRTRGDAALLHYSETLDHSPAKQVSDLRISQATLAAHWDALDSTTKEALQTAHDRIKAYGEAQKLTSWSYTDADGSKFGQQITALDSVGLYVPGGKASYPSSVLMNAVPAKVAGVARLVMVVPCPRR
ncbi:histidinol dehydrogenase [Suttonella sp. R2A3]|nr:histidinol dehydrogenase [Suttonella sp. R2A3]UJF24561.1 histidinol dehydrogenase [Suttonella sp. R2A3]